MVKSILHSLFVAPFLTSFRCGKRAGKMMIDIKRKQMEIEIEYCFLLHGKNCRFFYLMNRIVSEFLLYSLKISI